MQQHIKWVYVNKFQERTYYHCMSLEAIYVNARKIKIIHSLCNTREKIACLQYKCGWE